MTDLIHHSLVDCRRLVPPVSDGISGGEPVDPEADSCEEVEEREERPIDYPDRKHFDRLRVEEAQVHLWRIVERVLGGLRIGKPCEKRSLD